MQGELIGHKVIWERLVEAQKQGRLSHAYLFVGPGSLGKKTFVRRWFASLLGWKAQQGLQVHPDVKFLAREWNDKTDKMRSEILVEQVRVLIDHLSLSALADGWKLACVEEADRLSEKAANALLKTLEEPRGKAVLVLCTPSLERVPATVRSRCQIVRFALVPHEEIRQALVERGADRELAQEAASVASGRPGVALSYVHDGAFRAAHETAGNALRSCLQSGVAQRLRTVNDLLPKEENDKAESVRAILSAWERQLREGMLAEVHASSPARATSMARALRALQESRDALGHNLQPLLALEHIVLNFPSL